MNERDLPRSDPAYEATVRKQARGSTKALDMAGALLAAFRTLAPLAATTLLSGTY